MNMHPSHSDFRDTGEPAPLGHNRNSDPGPDASWGFDVSAFNVEEGALVSGTSIARFEAAIREQGDKTTRLRAIDEAGWRWRKRLSGRQLKLYSAISDLAKMSIDGKEPRAALMSIARIGHICGVEHHGHASAEVQALEGMGAITALRWMVGKKKRGYFSPTVTADDRRGLTSLGIIRASKGADDDVRAFETDRKRKRREAREADASEVQAGTVPPESGGIQNPVPPETGGTEKANVPPKTGGLSHPKRADCPTQKRPLVSSLLVSTSLGSKVKEEAAPSTTQEVPHVERLPGKETTSDAKALAPVVNVPLAPMLDLGGQIVAADPTPQQVAGLAKRCDIENPTDAQRRHIVDVLRKATAQWSDAEIMPNDRRKFGDRKTWGTLHAWFESNWLPRLRKELAEIEQVGRTAAATDLEKLFASPKAMVVGKDWLSGEHCRAAFEEIVEEFRSHVTCADFVKAETRLRTRFEKAPDDIPGSIAAVLNGIVLFRVRGPLSHHITGPYWRTSSTGTWAIPQALAATVARALAIKWTASKCDDDYEPRTTEDYERELLSGKGFRDNLGEAFEIIEASIKRDGLWKRYGDGLQAHVEAEFERLALNTENLSHEEKLKSGAFVLDAQGFLVPRSVNQPKRRGFVA